MSEKKEGKMKEPTFDRDGYPTKETLQVIEKWDDYTEQGRMELLRFIQKAWYYPDWVAEKDGLFVFATGGWSGNEELISAFRENVLWHILRKIEIDGGFYVFGVGKNAERVIEDEIEEIVEYFWSKVSAGDKGGAHGETA